MNLRTAHRRARAKLFKPVLAPKALRCLLLCNRFAAGPAGFTVTTNSYFDFGGGYWNPYQAQHARINGAPIKYYFRGVFYVLKDRVMDAYGRREGHTLQYWSSYAADYDDYGDGGGIEDACHHYHILERIRLRDAVLHRPTNHFSFCNDVTGYCKESVGFDEMKALCTDRIEGKKCDNIGGVPSAEEALTALKYLAKRFGRLPLKAKERPRIKVDNFYWLPAYASSSQPVPADEGVPF